MAIQKSERPPGTLEAAAAVTDRWSERRQNTASGRKPQAVLARAETSDRSAVEILHSRDGSRLTICPLHRPGGAPWQLVGAVSSIPAVLLDATIEALQRARDAIAGAQH